MKGKALIFLCICIHGLFAQNVPSDGNMQDPEIYTLVEEQAEFPGGISAQKKYLDDNISYPKGRTKTDEIRKCFIRFIVNKNGSISNAEILKGVPDCLECDKEALRVVKSMPAWKPGKMKGKAVDQYYNLPVAFYAPTPLPPVPLSPEAEATEKASSRAKTEAEKIAKAKAEAEAKAKAQQH